MGGLAQFLKRRRRHPLPSSRRPLRELKQRYTAAKSSNFGNLNYKICNYIKYKLINGYLIIVINKYKIL